MTTRNTGQEAAYAIRDPDGTTHVLPAGYQGDPPHPPHAPRRCFYIPEGQHDEHGYIPSLVTENEPGHAPLKGDGSPTAAAWYWGKTLEEAQGVAALENARLGLTRDDVNEIILSSMRAGGAR